MALDTGAGQQAGPTFVGALGALSAEDRLKALQAEHPHYARYRTSWQVLLDAYEAAGGFHDGEYLWPYPRENDQDFRNRKGMARYHNYVDTLIDMYVRYVYTQGVKRTSASESFNAWQMDVDGAGTGYNDLLKRLAAISLVNGHAGLLVDKTADTATGPTRADERARVVASVFPAPSIMDWRYEGDLLTAVKLREAGPQPDITQEFDPETAVQYLLWDETGWARYTAEGNLIGQGDPGLGFVPLVVLRPKPSGWSPMLGRPLVSAMVVRALFNRASEEDEVLRSQAFSVLTVELDKEANLDEARTSIGSVVGAAKALIVKGKIDYKTPDMTVPSSIRDNISYLVQELYRSAHVRFRRDSLQAESGDAIRLQYAELNEMLQGLCASLRDVEMKVARAWFAWTSASPAEAERAFKAANVTVEYPDEFFLDSLIADLEAWAEAIRMNLGPTMAKRIKKRAARRVEPDMPEQELAQVDAEIDAQTPEELNPSLLPAALDTGRPFDANAGEGDITGGAGGD